MALGMPAFHPATPMGIMMMLDRYQIDTEGKHCVVLGRSNIVGTPISLLMSKKSKPGNATVTIAHSRSQGLEAITKTADIIIVALGIPRFLKAHMVKEGVVIIDVGINKIDDQKVKSIDKELSGIPIEGDVDYDAVAPLAKAITPVPGGVGPMTITALLENTWKAFQKSI